MTPPRACPPIELTAGLTRMPVSPADLYTSNCLVFQVVFCNTTGGAVTVTVKDRQTSARYIANTLSIPANSTTILDFPAGLTMLSGINWASGSDAIDCEIAGFRRAVVA